MIRKLITFAMIITAIFLYFERPSEAAKVKVDTDYFIVKYSMAMGKFRLELGTLWNLPIEPRSAWEGKVVSPSVVHIRIPDSSGTFLKLDMDRKQVYAVSGGTFGKEGGSEKLLKSAKILPNEAAVPVQLALVQIRLEGTELVFDTENNPLSLTYEGLKLMGAEDFEVIRSEPGVYHFRLRAEQDASVRAYKQRMQQFKDSASSQLNSFWKLDFNSKRMSRVAGPFGERGGQEVIYGHKVTFDAAASGTASKIHDDLGMLGIQRDMIQESSWILAERELFREMLGKQQFDALIVPFEVQDYAFDHVERSLMTRYLYERLKTTTDLKIPDPDLVERALGLRCRTYPIQRIYGLANSLGVKTLIRGYAGHNRNMKMRVTIAVQDKPENGGFDTEVKAREIIFEDMAFSDERLPSDVFVDALPSISSAIGVKQTRKGTAKDTSGLQKVSFPPKPLYLVQNDEKSPLVQAAYLSILGALSPDGASAFFTRSLALLRNFTPKSQDAVFLRAYAYTSLARRPAAVEALKKPMTPEQIALSAYLDGDFAVLPKLVVDIKSPIPKFLMQMSLYDLHQAYDYQSAQMLGIEEITDVPPAWKMFLARRVGLRDPWRIFDAADLKQFLDDTYPIRGYAVQDIAGGMLVRGDLYTGDMIKMDTSIHEHRKRTLREKPEITTVYTGDRITPLDLIDFVSAWAESDAEKNVIRRVSYQGLYEDGINLVTKYEAFYKDHPVMTALKVEAIKYLAYQHQGDERKNLLDEASNLSRNACIWMQGQNRFSSRVCSGSAYYENDFPRRAYWRINDDLLITGSGDRDEYQPRDVAVKKSQTPQEFAAKQRSDMFRDHELALLYSIGNFNTLVTYYDALMSYKMEPEAQSLLERNKDRFNGNPGKAVFLAKQSEKKDDDKRVERLYEDAILVTPRVWSLYYGLGLHYLKHGDNRRAKSTFNRFSLFHDSNWESDTGSVDTVSLSNFAFRAGIALHDTGAVEDANQFFRLSAGYQTGSASGMWSDYILALDDNDYRAAATTMLSLGRRYPNHSADAYENYLCLLSVTGHNREAEKLFSSMGMLDKDYVRWSPLIISQRQASKSDKEMRTWLLENGKEKVNRYNAQYYYLWSFLLDRAPNPDLADTIENIERNVPMTDEQRAYLKEKDKQGRELPSVPSTFASSRYLFMKKHHEKLYSLLERFAGVSGLIEKGEGRFLLHYFAWSGTKTGKKPEVDKVMGEYKSENGRDFEFWLATAMMQAAAGDHKAALETLELARTNIWNTNNTNTSLSWYRLIESCELLFEDSKDIAYRDRALDLARIYQRVQPFASWAYAVEAKYAKTEEERLRPLALTLYLDRRSYHIEGISTKQKDKALKWLDENNPFLQDAQHVQKHQI